MKEPLNKGYIAFMIYGILPSDSTNIINLLNGYHIIYRHLEVDRVECDIHENDVLEVISTIEYDTYKMGGHYIIKMLTKEGHIFTRVYKTE